MRKNNKKQTLDLTKKLKVKNKEEAKNEILLQRSIIIGTYKHLLSLGLSKEDIVETTKDFLHFAEYTLKYGSPELEDDLEESVEKKMKMIQ